MIKLTATAMSAALLLLPFATSAQTLPAYGPSINLEGAKKAVAAAEGIGPQQCGASFRVAVEDQRSTRPRVGLVLDRLECKRAAFFFHCFGFRLLRPVNTETTPSSSEMRSRSGSSAASIAIVTAFFCSAAISFMAPPLLDTPVTSH